MTNFSNSNSGKDNDPSKKPGQLGVPSVPTISVTQAKPVPPTVQQTSVGKLGRGLGRLIPIKNAPENAEKQTLTSVDSRSTAMQSVIQNTSAPSNQTTISNSSSTGIKIELKNASVVFGNGVERIDVSKIRPNPRQPRTDFKNSELEGLAASIKLNGLLQPIIIRPVSGLDGQFEIVAGERRWRAFKMLGEVSIPSIVVQASDEHSGLCALIENVHRTDLNPMDRALAVLKLSEEFSLTHDKLAQKLSLDRSTITNLLRLAELDSQTASLVRQGVLTQGHAKALLGVVDIKTRTTLAESSVRGEWSVRALEREVQRLATESKSRVPRGTQPARRQANVKDLETRLSTLLGTRVTIQLGRKPNTGKVSMEFFSLDQFEGMLAKLGLRTDQIRFEN